MKNIPQSVKNAAAAAATVALFFILLEMIKACRSSLWSGATWNDYLGILCGYLLYFLFLFILILFIQRILNVGRPKLFALPIAILIAGSALWTLLSLCREISPTFDDAIVISGLFLFAAAIFLLPATQRFTIADTCLLAGSALLAGISALLASADFYLFHENRNHYVTIIPMIWMMLSALPGIGVWLYTRSARVIYALAIILLPQALDAVSTTPGHKPAGNNQPNVILIVSDALRADYLRLHGGSVPAPNIERLAREGVLFDNAYALAPWTLPSMTSLFASTYPQGLTPNIDGTFWLSQIWQYGVQPTHPTLAELLKKRGYTTGAITSNALMWSIPGLMNGFDTRASAHPILLAQEGLFRHLPFLQDFLAKFFPPLDGLRPHNACEDMAHYSHAFLARARSKNFFLWTHYIDPHAPYDPPQQFRPKEKGPWPFFYPFAGGERWNIPKQGPGFSIRQEDQPYVRALYEGEIQYIDKLVGQLINQLDTLGLRSSTYICFTSDHGEELWDHGDWGHGHTVYQELLRVPLIIAGPGVKPQRIADPVSAIDLIPTLADLVGEPRLPQWKGASFAEALRGNAPYTPPQAIFAQGTSNRAYPNPFQTVISGDWKLIRKAGTQEVVLFDLHNDPKESHDLSADQPERVQDLLKRLESWLASYPSTFPPPADANTLDRDKVDQLRAMGYL
ncbi:MAG TPA: sulfatase-like hydrolase/transferase [Candidatus Hydrogenedentes bacterium]|nr:sulfatase-like hydrolase/transferase [Candidatus Hydrogenedentota bacterium]